MQGYLTDDYDGQGTCGKISGWIMRPKATVTSDLAAVTSGGGGRVDDPSRRTNEPSGGGRTPSGNTPPIGEGVQQPEPALALTTTASPIHDGRPDSRMVSTFNRRERLTAVLDGHASTLNELDIFSPSMYKSLMGNVWETFGKLENRIDSLDKWFGRFPMGNDAIMRVLDKLISRAHNTCAL
jgi:hypothetical protein